MSTDKSCTVSSVLSSSAEIPNLTKVSVQDTAMFRTVCRTPKYGRRLFGNLITIAFWWEIIIGSKIHHQCSSTIKHISPHSMPSNEPRITNLKSSSSLHEVMGNKWTQKLTQNVQSTKLILFGGEGRRGRERQRFILQCRMIATLA